MTTTTIRNRHTAVNVIVDGKPVYATATGLKLTARGRVVPASHLYGVLPKGTARKVRKALRKAGDVLKAAEPRMPDTFGEAVDTMTLAGDQAREHR